MKRLLILGLSAMAIVLFACNDKGAATGSSDDKHKEMLDANRAVLKAIETGDTATLHKYIADDAVDHGAGDKGADVTGPQQVINMLAEAHSNIDNLKFEVIQDAANDDYIFCLARMTGTVKKTMWGMPPGTKVDSKAVDVLRVKDMKMQEHWGYLDPAEMMKMMSPGAMHDGMDSTKK